MKFVLSLTSTLLVVLGSEACILHGSIESDVHHAKRDLLRRTQPVPQPSGLRTAITIVRVFDGVNIQEPMTIFIENDTIINSEAVFPNDTVVDAQGGVLLPGLIDSHCHSGNQSDYLKITAETNGPDQDTENALVSAAHALGLPTMTHASTLLAFQQAVLSKSNSVEHVPIDANLSSDYFEFMLQQHQYGTPTMEAARLVLTLAETYPDIGAMVGVGSSASNGNSSYANWKANAAAMYRAGVPMLAGTVR
jgi:imidazolonepropionase-like amidohydrolase